MDSAYPPTGFYDDVLMILARSEEARMKGKIPVKTAAGRLFLEPLANLAGLGVAAVLRLLPARRAAAVQDAVFRALIGANPPCPFDESSPHLKSARSLIAQARGETGSDPALFCLTSHPPAYGDLLYLNVELMRHALWALRSLRGGASRPRLVIGMDYFALDMLSLPEEGAYAGFTGAYHLGFDRLAHLRAGAGGRMLGFTGWPKMAGRLLKVFRRGGEVGMVLGGGVPQTSRLFYCAREFAGRLYRERPRRDGARAILDRLRKASPEFKAFSESGVLRGALAANARRTLEAWLIERLIADGGLEDVDEGRVNSAGRAAVLACASALGYTQEAARSALAQFEEEFARENPYRERFFRVVCSRTAGRGRPLLILPLTYGNPDRIRMAFGEPVCVLNARDGRFLIKTAGAPAREVEARSFCRDFVSREYP